MLQGRSTSLGTFFSVLSPRSELPCQGPFLDSVPDGSPCALYAFSMHAYFSTWASISKKSTDALFSNEKMKGHHYNLLFMMVMATAWSRLYTSRATALNWLTYIPRDFHFPCLILIRESEPRCGLLFLIKCATKELPNQSKKCMEFGFKFEYLYMDAFLRVEERFIIKPYQQLHGEALEP